MVDTRDPRAVAQEVQSSYLALFPGGDLMFVPRVFGWAIDCFSGNYDDYQPIDALYHDLEHTLQGALCMVRLLHQRQLAGAHPPLDQEYFELGLLAILFHDTGYLKKRTDTEGTGAKYTLIHVERSADFADQMLALKGYSGQARQAVKNMIHCTGINIHLESIPFANALERIVGFALGTSDLLGQMAAEDYTTKLPELYLEFAESARYHPGRMSNVGFFANADELMRKTPQFWDSFVRPKLEHDFGGLYKFLNNPYPDGPNEYLTRIEANIARLQKLNARPTVLEPSR